ncbi:MAG: GNAT family N-acetyltransferase [Actinobacteria bacterium]|nr:MAG: GNAT family N-acetyltransferase [Actinomycetota bacterium]
MSEVTIRAAGLSDARAVLALWREADAEATHTDNVESLSRLIGHNSQALIVAEEGGQIVGSVIAGWDGWRGSIYRLAVAPARRRRGIGTRMLHQAESLLAAAGATRSQAIVVEPDGSAIAFWRASGWEQQTDRVRFVKG